MPSGRQCGKIHLIHVENSGLPQPQHARAQVVQEVFELPFLNAQNLPHTEDKEQGSLLLQMADLEKERVRAYFDEPEIGHLAVGQPILIKWDAKQGKVWHGHIVRVPVTVTVITNGTRTVGEVLVQIDGDDGGLLPDTNVTVTVTTSSESDKY